MGEEKPLKVNGNITAARVVVVVIVGVTTELNAMGGLWLFAGRGAVAGALIGFVVGAIIADVTYLRIMKTRIPPERNRLCPQLTVHSRHVWVDRTAHNMIVEFECEGVERD